MSETAKEQKQTGIEPKESEEIIEKQQNLEEVEESKSEEAKEDELTQESNSPQKKRRRYKGVVSSFYSRKGYGFIQVLDNDVQLNSSKLFVHWQQIKTHDRWPKLEINSEVEFYINRKENKQFASEVSGPDGALISYAVEGEIVTKTKIKGSVKFFNPRRGFGFVELSEDFIIDASTKVKAGTDIHVGRESIISTNPCPILEDDQIVTFMLKKSKKGYQAVDVTAEDGEPIHIPDYEVVKKARSKRSPAKREAVKQQQAAPTLPHFGDVVEWSEENKCGWIVATAELVEQNHEQVNLNRQNTTKRIKFKADDILPGNELKEKDHVCFVLNVAEDGTQTATQVLAVDRTDLFFKTKESTNKFYFPSLLSIIVEDQLVPRIIGKKGATIREINRNSGSFVHVVDVDQQHHNKRIMNITGYAPTIKKACHMIMYTIYGGGTQVGRFTFVFHDVQRMMGKLIGKRGANINILRRIPGLNVKVKKCAPFMGQPMSSLKLEGDLRSVRIGINIAVDMLIKLYFETVQEYFNTQAFQWGDW